MTLTRPARTDTLTPAARRSVEYAPVVLIALGGVLFAIGAWLGPETVTGSTLDAETADAAPAAVPASLRVTTEEMS